MKSTGRKQFPSLRSMAERTRYFGLQVKPVLFTHTHTHKHTLYINNLTCYTCCAYMQTHTTHAHPPHAHTTHTTHIRHTTHAHHTYSHTTSPTHAHTTHTHHTCSHTTHTHRMLIGLCTELVLACQTVPGSQDAVL